MIKLPFLGSREVAEALASRVSSSSIPPPVTTVLMGAITLSLLMDVPFGPQARMHLNYFICSVNQADSHITRSMVFKQAQAVSRYRFGRTTG